VPHILVIGGGPAGLRAAEVASAAGAEVTLCDQKRSVGRKFLVAGKGGLNLTHSEELDSFVMRYQGPDQPDAILIARRFARFVVVREPWVLVGWLGDEETASIFGSE
jgi:predicted flavoprotein YhiN